MTTMLGGTCPRWGALHRALSPGQAPDAALQAHILGCPLCQRERDAVEALLGLGRELPYEVPDRAQRDAARARLLQAAAAVTGQRPLQARPRWPLWALAAAAALLVAFGLGLRLRGPAPEGRTAVAARHGTVRSLGEARYVEGGAPQDEIVRLAEGTILVEVSPLRPGERFRVLTGDSEVEVRGTLFEVQAREDRLRSVRVVHGEVDVRPARRAPVRLRSDERWPAEAPVGAGGDGGADGGGGVPDGGGSEAAAPSKVVVTPGKAAAPASVERRPPRHGPARAAALALPAAVTPVPRPEAERTPAEQAFGEGFDALRAGQYGPAAAAFSRAAAAAPTGPMAEDARYWGAVATARAGRGDEAVRALRDFLARHPASPRAGEASSILGWLLLDGGQLDEAERRFQAAARDRAPAVQRSAREGLAATAALRARGR